MLKDADGYPIREIRCRPGKHRGQGGGLRHVPSSHCDDRPREPRWPGPRRLRLAPHPDATQRPITIQVPIRFDNHVRGDLLVNLSPALAMGGVQALSDQISSSSFR